MRVLDITVTVGFTVISAISTGLVSSLSGHCWTRLIKVFPVLGMKPYYREVGMLSTAGMPGM